MKVAVWADNVLDPVMSGMGQHQRGLLRALDRVDSELELSVFYTQRRVGQPFPVPLKSLERRPLPGVRHLWYPVWHSIHRPAVDRFVGTPDLVHLLHSSVTVPAAAPRIVWIVDLASARHPAAFPRRRRIFKDAAIRRAVADASVTFVTNTEFVKAELCDLYDVAPERVTPVLLGIDHERFRPVDDPERRRTVRERYRLPPEFVLFVGLVSPRKNVDLLIEGFEMHRRRHGDELELVLAGAPGWDCESVLEAADAAEGVTFVGFVADEDLAAVYSMARALVFPSRYEGFGMPLIEAMASGTPVIAGSVSAIPEVVGDAALLLDELTPEAIAGAIDRISADRQLVEGLRDRGLDRAARYTWDRAARHCVDLYRERLAG